MKEQKKGSLGEYSWPLKKEDESIVNQGRLEKYRQQLVTQRLSEKEIEKELNAYILCTMD